MEPRAEAAEPALTLQPPIASIGVEVDEPLFLDEADGHGQAPPKADEPSPFDLFADEDDLPAVDVAPSPEPTPTMLDVRAPEGAPRGNLAPLAPVQRPATPPSSRRTWSTGTMNLVALFVLVATVTMLITIQACQTNHAMRTARAYQSAR